MQQPGIAGGGILNGLHPVPKPAADKPKKKKQNGYKDKPMRYCFYTGAPNAERHEIYGGPNRQISIDHRFQVDLCPEIHQRFHDPQTDEDINRIIFWKKHYQIIFEEEQIETGKTADQARDAWIELIGKSFL
jgi:hypothetical protein